MACDAQTPQEGCGTWRAEGVRGYAQRTSAAASRASALVLAGIVLAWMLGAGPALAQHAPSSFPRTSAPKFTAPNKLDKKQPLLLTGDQLIYDTTGNRVVAKGNVELYYNNYAITADEVEYDQAAGTLIAKGNVTIKDPNGEITHGDRINLTDDFKDGFVESLSVVGTDNSRISARRAVRKGGNVTEFTDARYSPCVSDPGKPPLWCISAAKIIHDTNTATLTYQDAQFEFFGVPVLYFPFFEHPDPTVKHRSGFLIPEFGNSTTLGTKVEVPYYFALSPSYDFLFHPEYLSKQGVLWKGDWRQRLANGQYTINLAGIDQNYRDLPSSVLTGTSNPQQYDGWRGSIETHGKFSLSSWWQFGWDVTVESDDTFRRFYGLDNVLLTDRVNQIYLNGQSDRNFFGMKFYQLGGLLLDGSNQAQSRALPVIDYDYIFKDPVLGGELGWQTTALALTRDHAVNGGTTETYNHLKSELKWRRRLIDQGGISYTPFGDLRGDAYYYENAVNPATNLATPDTTLGRVVGTAGVTVGYPWVASSGGATHTIEPIGQALYTEASVHQRVMPDEDSRSLIFDDTNLFEIQKFSGTDRIETGTRANAGLQYTFQSNDGGYARFLLGQHYQLGGQNAYTENGSITETVITNGVSSTQTPQSVFSPVSGLQHSRSDYVLGAYFAPVSAFRLLSQSRFDESSLALRREDLFGSVNYGPVTASAVYTYAASDPTFGLLDPQQEIIGSLGLKLTDRWSLLGSLRYDLRNDRVLTDSVALKYADDCFAVTTTYQETFIQNAALGLENDRSVMVRIELKNLGGVNYRTGSTDYTFGNNQPPH